MRLALSLSALGVELNAHLMNQLEIAFPEILIFVLARLFISRHECLNFPYTRNIRAIERRLFERKRSDWRGITAAPQRNNNRCWVAQDWRQQNMAPHPRFRISLCFASRSTL